MYETPTLCKPHKLPFYKNRQIPPMHTSDVVNLLAMACPRGPSSVPSQGAALALACHCIMVHGGFRILDQQWQQGGSLWTALLSGLRSKANVYQPPGNWASDSVFQWQFVYSHSSGPLPITLTVNVHPETGRRVRGDSERGRPLIHASHKIRGSPDWST